MLKLLSLAALIGSLCVPAIAQNTPPAVSNTQPPARRVPFVTQPCTGDIPPGLYANDPDVRLVTKPTLTVMFHGNRFVAAADLADAFEKANPGQLVAYTAVPPAFTIPTIESFQITVADVPTPFVPDVVLGNAAMGDALRAMPGDRFKVSQGVLYSRVHGLVLMARAGDPKFSGLQPAKVLNDPSVSIVIPRGQVDTHPLSLAVYAAVLDFNASAPTQNPRLHAAETRHHRSIPARILASCEDVGFQYVQSQRYLEKAFPGRFAFLPYAITLEAAKSEESYAYVLTGSPRRAAADKFAAFLTSPTAVEILRSHRLEP